MYGISNDLDLGLKVIYLFFGIDDSIYLFFAKLY